MTPPLFPPVASLDEFERIRRETARFRPGAEAICGALGLATAALERFPDGSLPVFSVGDELVLKIYPPFERHERDTEAAALRTVEDHLPIPTPRVHAVGELEEWGYLLMGRLRGRSLVEVWPDLAVEDRLRLAGELGEALAALHAIRGTALDPLRIDWPAFLAKQRATALERQRARGLDERWCEQIPGFLDRSFAGHGSPSNAPAESLLHTEVMREHLLVEPGPDRWRLSGLYDFEPAMVGAPEYEFVAVGLFVSGGEPEVFRAVMRAYGRAEAELDAAFRARVMTLCLLHRYSNLHWFLGRVPPPANARTLEELTECWWGTTAPGNG
jgi:hygromycin-B 7''-O-kinase